MANKQSDIARTRRKQRVRKKVLGTDQRPRISVFKSNKHIYAQIISDDRGITLASVSTLSKDLVTKVENIKGVEAAKQVGLAWPRSAKKRIFRMLSSIATGFSFMGESRPLPMALVKAD